MAKTLLHIIDPNGVSVTLECPDDIPVRELIPALVESMDLPHLDSAGKKIQYFLKLLLDNDDAIPLDANKTLQENGVEYLVHILITDLVSNSRLMTRSDITQLRDMSYASKAIPFSKKQPLVKMVERLKYFDTNTTDTGTLDKAIDELLNGNQENTRSDKKEKESPPDENQNQIASMVVTADQAEKQQNAARQEGKDSIDIIIERLQKIDTLIDRQIQLNERATAIESTVRQQNENIRWMMEQIIAFRPKNEESPPLDVHPSRPAREFLDFDITVTREGQQGSYQARAKWSADRRSEGEKCTFQIPLTKHELEVNYLYNFGAPKKGPDLKHQQDLAKELGELLYNTIFERDVRVCFMKCRDQARDRGWGVRLRLDFMDAPELINYPWELLWNQDLGGFLCIHDDISVIRYMEGGRSSRSSQLDRNRKGPLRILIVSANPYTGSRLDIENEIMALRQVLYEMEQKNLIKIDAVENATPRKLRIYFNQSKEKPHIVHFIGHGMANANGEGCLVLESDRDLDSPGMDEELKPDTLFEGSQLIALLKKCRDLELVFLNTCNSAISNPLDPFSSIAMRLMDAQIPATIAMQTRILDRIAILFAKVFYENMIKENLPIHEALMEGRLQFFLDHNLPTEWMIPVLYSRVPGGNIL